MKCHAFVSFQHLQRSSNIVRLMKAILHARFMCYDTFFPFEWFTIHVVTLVDWIVIVLFLPPRVSRFEFSSLSVKKKQRSLKPQSEDDLIGHSIDVRMTNSEL